MGTIDGGCLCKYARRGMILSVTKLSSPSQYFTKKALKTCRFQGFFSEILRGYQAAIGLGFAVFLAFFSLFF
jgi:hypothetical protein